MGRFSLELIEGNSPTGRTPLQRLQARANYLADKLEVGNLRSVLQGESPVTERARFFVNELRVPCSWGTLEYIDGVNFDISTREEQRSFVDAHLSEEEIQEACTMAVNGALLVEREGAPGYVRGHSILIKDVADNQDSRFYDVITPDFANRLANGALWEVLGDLAYSVRDFSLFERLLTQRSGCLNPDFAVERGLDIMHRNAGNDSLLGDIDLLCVCGEQRAGLSDRALDSYFNLMDRIDRRIGDDETLMRKFSPAVLAYARALDEDDYGFPYVDDAETKRRHPLVEKYAALFGNVEAA